jgi:hypothetical protein
MIDPQIRAMNNYHASIQWDDQRSMQPEELRDLIERSGNYSWMTRAGFFHALGLLSHGRLDEALAVIDQTAVSESDEFWLDQITIVRLSVLLIRDGRDEQQVVRIGALLAKYADSEDPQMREGIRDAIAFLHFRLGEFDEVLAILSDEHDDPLQYPQRFEFGVAAAAMVGDIEVLAAYRRRLDRLGTGRAVQGLAAFAAVYESAVAGSLEDAAAHYQVADDLWSVAGAPDSHAIARAVTATLVGVETSLGREAAKASFDFFDGAGSTLYLDLFSDIFSGLQDDAVEDVAV